MAVGGADQKAPIDFQKFLEEAKQKKANGENAFGAKKNFFGQEKMTDPDLTPLAKKIQGITNKDDLKTALESYTSDSKNDKVKIKQEGLAKKIASDNGLLLQLAAAGSLAKISEVLTADEKLLEKEAVDKALHDAAAGKTTGDKKADEKPQPFNSLFYTKADPNAKSERPGDFDKIAGNKKIISIERDTVASNVLLTRKDRNKEFVLPAQLGEGGINATETTVGKRDCITITINHVDAQGNIQPERITAPRDIARTVLLNDPSGKKLTMMQLYNKAKLESVKDNGQGFHYSEALSSEKIQFGKTLTPDEILALSGNTSTPFLGKDDATYTIDPTVNGEDETVVINFADISNKGANLKGYDDIPIEGRETSKLSDFDNKKNALILFHPAWDAVKFIESKCLKDDYQSISVVDEQGQESPIASVDDGKVIGQGSIEQIQKDLKANKKLKLVAVDKKGKKINNPSLDKVFAPAVVGIATAHSYDEQGNKIQDNVAQKRVLITNCDMKNLESIIVAEADPTENNKIEASSQYVYCLPGAFKANSKYAKQIPVQTRNVISELHSPMNGKPHAVTAMAA